MCTRQVACSTSLLSRQRDVIASFSFGACTVQTNFIWRDISSSFKVYLTLFSLRVTVLFYVELLDSVMSSPGQKHGGCGHLMASFDTHSFCARCREKSKGPDPCVSKSDCQACSILTEDQRLQLSTPSYKIKKEKREQKKQSDTLQKNSDSSSLIDPSSVTVVGAVDDQGNLQSPGSSSGSDKKKKDKKTSSEKSKPGKSSDKPSKSVDKPSRSSADARIDELDKKWADRFNRLEALLLAKSVDLPEPTFQAPKVGPTHPPPVGAVKSSAPFVRPATNQPSSTDLSGTGHSTPLKQATSK